MEITPEELMKLCTPISEKDIEIAMLRKELEELRSQVSTSGKVQPDTGTITIKTENICKILKKLEGSPNSVAFLFLCLMKMKPEGLNQNTLLKILEAASLESFPIKLTANGDMNVEGNYTHITGNNNVNLSQPEQP